MIAAAFLCEAGRKLRHVAQYPIWGLPPYRLAQIRSDDSNLVSGNYQRIHRAKQKS
jgi:hypothetical protein